MPSDIQRERHRDLPPRMAGLLLDWYDKNAREMPWRSTPTPYYVLISEFMLQQTRVEAARAYFNRFIAQFPDIQSLAAAREPALLKLWEGLGYYSRARNLHKTAQIIRERHNGEIPREASELIKLPGIGAYTAGAVSSIAYQRPVPAVDGNVLRVCARLLSCAEDIARPAVKKYFYAQIEAVLPRTRPGDFNQAIMELGAMVCLPNGAPLCLSCPLSALCAARENGRVLELPVKAEKKKRKVERRAVFLIHYEGQTAIRRRPDKGLLSSLWEFPNTCDEDAAHALSHWGIAYRKREQSIRTVHVFTHIEWHMQGYVIHAATPFLPPGWIWADKAALTDIYAVPSAFRAFQTLIP